MKRISLFSIFVTTIFFTCRVSAQQELVDSCVQQLQPKFNICGWKMCAFDINAEFVFLCRDDNFRAVDFTSDGIAGEIVLNSHDLDMGWAPGWRLTGEIFFDTCDRIEVSYLSMGRWHDSKKVTSADNSLYSILSFFGANPFGGFEGTDEASLHKIDYESKFYTWEVNYRNHLSLFEIPCFCCLDGSIFYGYRNFKLDEKFCLETRSELNNAEMDYQVKTTNALQGVQIGAEMWIPISNWMDIGVEAKGTAYVNCAEQKTAIVDDADLPDGEYRESKDGMNLAWGIEAAVRGGFEICPSFYLRVGYLFLYLENVALAVDNFNKRPPFNGGRSKKLKTSGELTYHGITMGLDWCW